MNLRVWATVIPVFPLLLLHCSSGDDTTGATPTDAGSDATSPLDSGAHDAASNDSATTDAATCSASTCADGCCDATGTCKHQTVPACGAAGVACSTVACPQNLPEADHLGLWLEGDFGFGSGRWTNLKGDGTTASCAAATCPTSTTYNGHTVISFAAGQYLSITDVDGSLTSQSWDMHVVAKPSSGAAAYAQLLEFLATTQINDYVKLQRDSTNPDIVVQVGNNSTYNVLTAHQGWNDAWELVSAGVGTSGNGYISLNQGLVDGGSADGSIGIAQNVDYNDSDVGAQNDVPTYVGQVAEIVVFSEALSPASTTALQTYFNTRYALW